jgi:hypothetical protein
MADPGSTHGSRPAGRIAAALRPLRLPLLLCYIALLVLAAWRTEIRPAVLDRPSEWAERSLRRAGIFAGIAVFSPDVARPSRQMFYRQRCLEVLAGSGTGAPEQIYPVGRDCPASGFRWWVGPEETMLTRLMTWATDDEAERRLTGERAAPDELTGSAAILPSIAYHFDRRERSRGRPRDRLTMLYTQHMVDIDTGQVTVDPVVLFGFTVGGGPGTVLWRPTDRQIAQHWRAGGGR